MPSLALRTSVPQNIHTAQLHRTQVKAMPGLPSGCPILQNAPWAGGRAGGSFLNTSLVMPKHAGRRDRAAHISTQAMAPQAAEALSQLCNIMSDPTAVAVKADGMKAINVLCQASTQGASGSNDALNTFLNLAFPLVLVGGMFALMRGRGGMPGGQGGMFDFGKSRAKLAKETETPVTFKDVAGIDYALEELQEIVNFLKQPEKYRELGAKPPKGVLLEGNPGVGKTLLAQAIAGEAGVPFYSCNGSEFVEMFVGVGASRVRDLFERAKSQAPCIIFIDELDAIGRQRGASGQMGNGETENTLNQLLGEMDGFGQDAGIIIIAATNRADVLDRALLRPGRFDRQLRINPPDKKGRLHILKVHARNRKLAASVDLKKVARRTLGMTGADLNNLLNEAVMRAGKLGKFEATMEHIDWAYERIVAGASRPDMIVSPDKKKLVAYHEAGHALLGDLLGQEVASVSIVPRDRAAGLTWFTPTERSAEDGIETRRDLEIRNIVALGGRVAEEMIYGPEGVTTGAGSDLQKVAQVAYAMVDNCGFGKGMAPRATLLGGDGGRFSGPQVSEKELAQRSDAVNELAFKAEREAKRLMTKNKESLHAIANALLVAETISGDQLKAIIKGRKWDEVVVSEDGDELDLEDDNLVPAVAVDAEQAAA